jgi:KDO2-lipid IV(A) lauroyltransferase
VFANFGRTVVDFLLLGSSSEGWRKEIELEGGDALWNERKAGRPVVLVSAHLGSWEVGAVSLALQGVPLAVVSRRHHNRAVEEFFVELRRKAGLEVLQLPGAAGRIVEVLRERGCVGMLADRGFGAGKGVRFFGRMARMPWGAVACALRTGACLLPGYTVREKDRWRVVLGRPLRLRRTGDWRGDLQRGMIRCVEALENFIREHPEQWFVFEPIWND